MKSNCGPQFSFFGRANATDWTRTLWAVHTKGNNSNDPSMDQILTWMKTADDDDAWSNVNAYTLMRDEADQIGGVIGARFEAASERHGIGP
jgi:hypothetical protein